MTSVIHCTHGGFGAAPIRSLLGDKDDEGGAGPATPMKGTRKGQSRHRGIRVAAARLLPTGPQPSQEDGEASETSAAVMRQHRPSGVFVRWHPKESCDLAQGGVRVLHVPGALVDLPEHNEDPRQAGGA